MRPIDIKKNAKDTLRISQETFKGYELVNMRVFYDAGEGDLRPGKQGVAFRLDLLPEVVAALQGFSVSEGSEPEKEGAG